MYEEMAGFLASMGLHTVCQSASCPNIGECFSRHTATFMILGDACTRSCGFCGVSHDAPHPVDPDEPRRVAEASVRLGLRYVVVTSVTRDDLPDGGAAHFAATIAALRRRIPGIRVEALIPDFGGNPNALDIVLAVSPEILNHNLETTESLYPAIGRPASGYRRSLEVLRRAKERGFTTKSGLMIGLGESRDDLLKTFRDLRQAGCDLLTIGQYLRPSPAHAPVVRYYPPEEFAGLKTLASAEGFPGVEAGPLVRSSYHAQTLQASFERGRGDAACAP